MMKYARPVVQSTKDIFGRLDETDGWMECECCHKSSQDMRFQRTQSARVPLFTMKELTLYAREVLG